MGERLLCKQEVVGSIPSGSTIRLRLRYGVIGGAKRDGALEKRMSRRSPKGEGGLADDVRPHKDSFNEKHKFHPRLRWRGV